MSDQHILGSQPTNQEISERIDVIYYEELYHLKELGFEYHDAVKRVYQRRVWLLLREYNRLGDHEC